MMACTLRTLLLIATAIGALTTAAAAAPPMPVSTTGMASMHAAGTAAMHPGSSGMAGLRTAMMADPAVHESMLDDPAMQADCPMLAGESMATMHGTGGSHLDHHRGTPRR